MAQPSRPGLTEALVVWGLGALIAVATFITYARLPAEELYNTSGDGLDAGASRVVVFLGYSFSIAAIPLAWIAAARIGTRPAALAAIVVAALCATMGFPGVIDQSDLDARPVNGFAAIGVAIALGLTVVALVRRGVGVAETLGPPDVVRAALAGVLLVAGLPWLFAEAGFYISDAPLLGNIFLSEEIRPSPGGEPSLHAVHLGRHHGMDGLFLALAVLLLSRVLRQMPSSAQRIGLTAYLSLMLVYGLANAFQDFWVEQLVKRDTTSLVIPSLIRPELSWAWAAMLLTALLIYLASSSVVRVNRSRGGDS